MLLLQLVQVLSDLNLVIKKAYITSDGNWFMDGEFFHDSFLYFRTADYSNSVLSFV